MKQKDKELLLKDLCVRIPYRVICQEEEHEEYNKLCAWVDETHYEFGESATEIQYYDTWESIDYLNSIHVDYRCLIHKGLALEAPKGMYNINLT